MKHLTLLIYAWLLEAYRKPLMLSNATMKILHVPGFNKLRAFNGKARAYAEFIKAKNRVPAYASFLKEKGFSKPSFKGMTPLIHEIPPTDKENYVKQFSIEARCIYGKIPDTDVIIDESSGSSGTATNWARGKKERLKNAKVIKFGVQHLLGEKPLFIINAFALGPWATGVNITMSCVKFAKLKSLGPDKFKIENTIKQFGTKHHYVIMGYPPFLKQLVDNSEINWKEHHVTFIFGGECMTEGMRDYMIGKGIKKSYSSLGASDLELNLAAENDFTISLRRLLRMDERLRSKILKHTGALPMVFQYNPADFLFETSDEGELIVTVCRPGYIAPKIRYNIHDRGHVMQLKEIYNVLDELGIDRKLLKASRSDLPILLHYGRADMTVSFFGSNISPTDIQESIYNIPEMANAIHSFSLNTTEDQEGNKQLIISFEMQKNKDVNSLQMALLEDRFFAQLALINQDFREARKMVSKADQMKLILVEFGEGPFKNNDIRIKAKYIQN